MTRKQKGSLISALVLAAIAPVLTLALLHAFGGTAEAQAPPPNYTKGSMPDLGQHSDSWCWVAAAANSFWWFGDNVTGEEGLLGGAGKPWKAIDPASLAPGAACGAGLNWLDARDAAPPAGDGPLIAGYPTVLQKIAEKTFHDVNQDGIKQGGELNYCYGEGVEKWDYLIGLRDYAASYGSGLVVHDIINPAQCGVSVGLAIKRSLPPATNALNPCGPGAVMPGGVPGVNQQGVPGQPTFLDYQTELSRGQDVLLWMENHTYSSGVPETAHVVTGVGYTNTGGAAGLGTVTISDPWTHTTNASAPPPLPVPSAFHTDGLVAPFQTKADHNTSPAQAVTDPYNLCDVIQVAPLQIRCYHEDTGAAINWAVVDMVFVSQKPVGGMAEAPDVETGGGSSAATYAMAGGAAALLVVLVAGGWYARRRLRAG